MRGEGGKSEDFRKEYFRNLGSPEHKKYEAFVGLFTQPLLVSCVTLFLPVFKTFMLCFPYY